MGRPRPLTWSLPTSGRLGPLVVAVIAWGVAALGLAARTQSGYGWIYLVAGALVGTIALLGVLATTSVRIDVAGGTARLGATVVPLTELGALSIVETRARRQVQHELRAPGLPAALFTSFKRTPVEERRALVDSLVDAARIRPLLERAHAGGAAFREAPELAGLITQALGEEARVRAALAILTRDHDNAVREAAAKLRGG